MWPFSRRPVSAAALPDSPFAADFAAIRDSLQKLRAAECVRLVHGATAHGFQLNPRLDARAVARFEAVHRIRLPEDHRDFLIHLGNGGAGPGYGLFSLGEVDNGDGDGVTVWRENEGLLGDPSQPFPHSGPWNDLTGRPEIDHPENLTPEQEDALFAESDAWEAAHYLNSRHVNGAVPLCHLGCALCQWLVVTGPEAGHVWNDFRADERGIFPVQIGSQQRVTFLQWYKAWLDEALRHA